MVAVSDLSQELIVSIAQRLDLLEDFLDFGAVCKSWRSAATKENFAGAGNLTHQVPLLMLPRATYVPCNKIKADVGRQPQLMKKKKNKKLMLMSDTADFFSLARGKILRLNLPEIKGKMCFSSSGWLLTHSEEDFLWSKSEKSLKLNLFHPISHSTIELPDGLPAPGLRIIYKLVLSSSPGSNPNYTVMCLTSRGRLMSCRPGLGEKSWTRLDIKKSAWELCCFRGQFYVLHPERSVEKVCSVSVLSDDLKHSRVVGPAIPGEIIRTPRINARYLVESAGVLLLVLFTRHRECYERTVGCRVFELPRNGNSWLDSEVKSLGNRTLFLSSASSSFSVEASDYAGCKPNCIYFINVRFVCPEVDLDSGIFNMADGTIDRQPFASFSTGFELVKRCPLWIQPTSC